MLPETSSLRPPIEAHFPTGWQAVLFRNWGVAPVARIAAALDADEASLRLAAAELGLDPALDAGEGWEKRGYLTVIRDNWQLLTFGQLTTLLGITEDKLAFLLKEDDFLWIKLGALKPLVEPPKYRPLTDAEKAATSVFRARVEAENAPRENAFAFLRPFTAASPAPEARADEDDGLRTVYSYFALYGDPLLEPELDPFPDALLAEYARMGVRGVWLQGVLYQLVPFPFDESLSEGWQTRIESLAALVKRAARYGIGVYLYLNEPRSMDEAFFARYPELRGSREGDFCAMCTSHPDVKRYLEDAARELFARAKGLAGFFTITMSENLTNCFSRSPIDACPCPRCAERAPWEVVAEVNNLLARGAHAADPNARAIAWNWGWREWGEKVPPLLTEGQIVQCTREENLTVRVGGVQTQVVDYTISQTEVGPLAKRVWRAARESGHEACAKVQINNTWELAAAPWLPVFDRVQSLIDNLRAEGVKHLQMSWTLGGYPSPALRFASSRMAGGADARAFLSDWLGAEDGETAYEAQRRMSEAFCAFPFHVGVAYTAPQNYGPAARFYLRPTGWKATMVGYPYDDLASWRSVYPEDAFEEQFARLVALWAEGAALIRPLRLKSADLRELSLMSDAALCHFESTLHHIRFVRERDGASRKDALLAIVRAERDTVRRLLALRGEDSRIGYEASNHYFYTVNDLVEKLVSLDAIEAELGR